MQHWVLFSFQAIFEIVTTKIPIFVQLNFGQNVIWILSTLKER